jgi:hypothetical protein
MQRGWIVSAWLVLIADGAATTGLLRTAIPGGVNVPALALPVHYLLGAGLCVLTIGVLIRSFEMVRWLATACVVATGVLGWRTLRGFDPRMAATHAFLAATGAGALTSLITRHASRPSHSSTEERHRPWIGRISRAGVFMVIAQVAIGAGLRHQLIGVEWHLLFAVLASLAILVPAVTVMNDAALDDRRRAARWVVWAIVTQLSLGAAVFVMMLVGPPSPIAWLTVTVAHVTLASVTLVVATVFAHLVTEQTQ